MKILVLLRGGGDRFVWLEVLHAESCGAVLLCSARPCCRSSVVGVSGVRESPKSPEQQDGGAECLSGVQDHPPLQCTREPAADLWGCFCFRPLANNTWLKMFYLHECKIPCTS